MIRRGGKQWSLSFGFINTLDSVGAMVSRVISDRHGSKAGMGWVYKAECYNTGWLRVKCGRMRAIAM